MPRRPIAPSGLGTSGLRLPKTAPAPAPAPSPAKTAPASAPPARTLEVSPGARALPGPSGPGTSGLRLPQTAAAPAPAPSPAKTAPASAPPARIPEVSPGARALPGPSGPGTSGLRIPRSLLAEAGLRGAELAPGAALAPGPGPGMPGPGLAPGHPGAYLPLPYVEREWGDGTYPPLYAPATARIDERLGEVVNDRLVAWARGVGIYADQLDKFRDAGFGRLAMLTHADTDDPDMLLVAARMNAAWWAADDYYADETSLGATPTELPPRLALVMSAMDPVAAAGSSRSPGRGDSRADPVLVALHSAIEHLTRHATPPRSASVQHDVRHVRELDRYAAWRYLRTLPAGVGVPRRAPARQLLHLDDADRRGRRLRTRRQPVFRAAGPAAP